MSLVTLACTHCGRAYDKWPSQVARSRFCSQDCLSASRRSRIELLCEVCGSSFETVPSKIGKRRTCSTGCLADFNARSDPLATHKACNDCGDIKPIDQYSPNVQMRDGLQGDCRDCRTAISQAYRRANPQTTKASARRSYAKHREQRKMESRDYQRRNRDKVRKRKREYAAANRDRIREYDAAYRKANRERVRFHRNNYDHRKRANGGDLTHEDWLDIRASFGGRCVYCSNQDQIELDHLVPVSNGGQHSKDNVVPACMTCNRTKSNKSLLAFLLYEKVA